MRKQRNFVTSVKQRFSIRKLTVGAASVLIGTSLFFMGEVSASIVHADTLAPQEERSAQQEKSAAPENNQETVKDPVDVATKTDEKGNYVNSDKEVNDAIDKYAEKKANDLNKQAGSTDPDNPAVIIRPSGKQPITVENGSDRKDEVQKIKDKIANATAKSQDDIQNYEKNHRKEISQGKEAKDFEDQGLSIDDERDAKISKIDITDNDGKSQGSVDLTKDDNEIRKEENQVAQKTGNKIIHDAQMTPKEKGTMGLKSDHKIIIDLDGNQDQSITVTYDNLKNSYYLKSTDGKTSDQINISRIERTFSNIVPNIVNGKVIFTPNGKDVYGQDAKYDECHGPQLVIYKDPSEGFFYNNIKQVSVEDIFYYRDANGKEQKLTFDPNDKHSPWYFVTSLNSDGVGNESPRRYNGDNKHNVEKFKAEGTEVIKIAGSTVKNEDDSGLNKWGESITHDGGWWYADEDNNGETYKWDTRDSEYSYIGSVAVKYTPGMKMVFGAYDNAWGSHWACFQTQVISTLHSKVISYDHIKDLTVTVDPEDPDPKKPNDPINPDDPDSPKYPSQDDLSEKITRNIYVDGDLKEKQPVTYVRNETIDKVTGKVLRHSDWRLGKDSKDSWAEYDPDIAEGHHISSITKDPDGKSNYEDVVSKDQNLTGVAPKKLNPKTDQNEDVYIHTAANEAHAKISYIDDTLDAQHSLLKTDTDNGQGKYEDKITFTEDPAEVIKEYEAKGYKLNTDHKDNFDPKASHTYGLKDEDNIFEVHFIHDTVTVDPEDPDPKKPNDPINPDDPDSPKYPSQDDLSEKITRNIYVDGDLKEKQPVTYVRNETIDKVTGKVLRHSDWRLGKDSKDSWAEYDPDIAEGHHISSITKDPDGKSNYEDVVSKDQNLTGVAPKKLNPKTDQNEDVYIHTAANEAHAKISYIDDTLDAQHSLLKTDTDNGQGKYEDKITFTEDPAEVIKEYEAKGYKLNTDHKDNFDPKASHTYGLKDEDNIFEVHFIHDTVTVDPEDPDPKKPNDPINPDDPDSPKYPSQDDLSEKITRNIYVDGDLKEKQPVTYVRNETIDKVTGKVLRHSDWRLGKDSKDSWAEYDPDIAEGHHISSITKDPDGKSNYEDVVSKDQNLTGVAPKKLNPKTDQNEDVYIHTAANEAHAKISYIDDTLDAQHSLLKTDTDNGQGKYEDKITFTEDPAEVIKEYEAKGYKLNTDHKDNFDPKASHTYGLKDEDNIFEVHFIHDTVTVDPEDPDPKKPNDPINPDDPDSPKYPSQDDLSEKITRNIYVDGDLKEKQPVTYVRNETIDKVTGKVLRHSDWRLGKDSKDSWAEYDPDIAEGHHISSITKDPDGKSNYEDVVSKDQNLTGVAPKKLNPKTDQNEDVYIHTAANEAHAKISYIDDTLDAQHSLLKTDTDNGQGKYEDKITFTEDPAEVIKEYEAKGYKLNTDHKDNFDPKASHTYGLKDEDNIFEVHFIHDTVTVDPEDPDPKKPNDPINPDDPDSPKYPSQDDLSEKITRNIYVDGDLKEKQPVTYVRNETIDKVTGKVLRHSDWRLGKDSKDSWAEYDPDIAEGHHISSITKDPDGKSNYEDVVSKDQNLTGVAPKKLNPKTDQNEDVYIHTAANEAHAKISYIDDTLDAQHSLLKTDTDNGQGKYEDKITFTEDPAEVIKEYEAKGYKLNTDHKDNFDPKASHTYGLKDEDNIFEVHFIHDTVTVDPEDPDPKKPNDPINPDDPDSPKYPSQDDLSEKITRNIYVDGDLKEKQPVTYVRNETIDKVTGKVLRHSDWRLGKDSKDSWAEYDPDIAEGHHISSITKDPDGKSNYEDVVSKDQNLTGVAPKKLNPKTDQNEDVYIHTAANEAHAKISYIDDTLDAQHSLLKTDTDNGQGKYEDKITFTEDPAEVIKEYEAKGYKLNTDHKDNFDPKASHTYGLKDEDNIFEVHFIHDTVTVDPEDPDPKKPNDPINPDDPDSPKYPSQDDLSEKITRNIYVDGDLKEKQPVTYVRNETIDKVTGKVLRHSDWRLGKDSKDSWAEYDPDIAEGHHISSITKDPDGKSNYEDVVSKDQNLTGVAPKKLNPKTDQNEDVYIHTAANEAHAKISYIDDTLDAQHSLLKTDTDNGQGKYEDKITFTEDPAEVIKEYEAKGYKLNTDHKDNFDPKASHTYGLKDEDNIFEVHFIHGMLTIDKTNPGKPGEPINPDKNGAKYPDCSDVVTKDVTRTIEYVDESGKQLHDSVTQTAHFTASGVLDKVTGNFVNLNPDGTIKDQNGHLTWSEDQKVDAQKSPVVQGYHLISVDKDTTDHINVDGKTLSYTDDSYIVTVLYAKNGKIIPVDPNGDPIPGAPTPTYPTDPDDPTKVLPDEPVPDIPGKTPREKKITPKDPGKDTKVIYDKIDDPDPEIPKDNPTTPNPDPEQPTDPAPTPELSTPVDPSQDSDDDVKVETDDTKTITHSKKKTTKSSIQREKQMPATQAKHGPVPVNNASEKKSPALKPADQAKLPQTGEADTSVFGLIGMMAAALAALFSFEDDKHRNKR